METRPSRLIVALVSLLVFLLTGQAGVQGYVWCLGEDGHAALEYAARARCAQGVQQQGPSREEEGLWSFPLEEHCGSCLDISTSVDAASRRPPSQRNLSTQAGFAAPAQIMPLPAFVRVLASQHYPQGPPRLSQTILVHRTVVLLN